MPRRTPKTIQSSPPLISLSHRRCCDPTWLLSHLLPLSFYTPPPGRPWPAWSSFAFRRPGQRSSGEVIAVYPQDVPYPSSSPFFLIFIDSCSVLVRLYSSSFEIWLGQKTVCIFLMHFLWEASDLFMSEAVILHISVPYSKIWPPHWCLKWTA